MSPIFDTHAHLYFPAFAPDLDQVIRDCEDVGVTHQVQIGCDEISCLAALNLAKERPNFYCTLGLHPCDVDQVGVHNPDYHRYAGLENYEMKTKNAAEFFAWIEALFLANRDKVVGFGETGFDLHHRSTTELYEQQKSDFLAHIDLCEKYDKTLVIHSRAAATETLALLTERQPKCRGIIHAFSEGPDFAETVVNDFGFYLGIGGVATYPKMEAVRAAIKITPLENLITETDAPFLTPHLARKSGVKTNSPKYLPEVTKLIAEIKAISVDECEARLFQNALDCFGLTQ